jgi:hypothetical protein
VAGVIPRRFCPRRIIAFAYLRARLTLGSGDKLGESFKLFLYASKPKSGLSDSGLPRHADNVVARHRA